MRINNSLPEHLLVQCGLSAAWRLLILLPLLLLVSCHTFITPQKPVLDSLGPSRRIEYRIGLYPPDSVNFTACPKPNNVILIPLLVAGGIPGLLYQSACDNARVSVDMNSAFRDVCRSVLAHHFTGGIEAIGRGQSVEQTTSIDCAFEVAVQRIGYDGRRGDAYIDFAVKFLGKNNKPIYDSGQLRVQARGKLSDPDTYTRLMTACAYKLDSILAEWNDPEVAIASAFPPGSSEHAAKVPTVLQLKYDDFSRMGWILVEVKGNAKAARDWALRRIEDIAITKNKALSPAGEPPGGSYVILDEQLTDGVLRIDFKTVD